MITLLEPTTFSPDGHLDGRIRDTRLPAPDDGLLRGAVLRLGDDATGPVISMTIQERLFPRKAPVHLHKSDTFRMALGEPIRVGGATYAHGEFRLQEADTFYGPEHWTDEVGTNQLLLIADRRGVKPYLGDAQAQRFVDEALADDITLEGVALHERDAVVEHVISNCIGASLRTGHFDGGFTDTSAWPALSDGSRLGVIGLGDPVSGPLLLGWDRPAGARRLPALTVTSDLVRLVVDGSCHLGDAHLDRLGFRLQQGGTEHPASEPGAGGAKELWILADRRGWPPAADDPLLDEVTALVTATLA